MLETVEPVILHALSLREKLARGDPLQLDHEQAALKALLRSEIDSNRLDGYGARRSQRAGGDSDSFLGGRYALACWLDEVFILDARYGGEWQEKKIEVSLYGTNDRAWKFWSQMRLAESLPTPDALEVFFLCAALGFRGELHDDPARFEERMTPTRARLIRDLTAEWRPPASRPLLRTVPPLRGLPRMRRVFLVAWAVILLAIPTVAFLLIRREAGK